MKRYALVQNVVLLALGLALAGCGARATPVPEPPTPMVTSVLSAVPESIPVPAARATPGASPVTPATAAPSPVATSEPFFLGVPAGDTYDPASIAVDPAAGRAYVYMMSSGAGGPVISTVDLATRKVQRLISLRAAGSSSSGEVLLSPDGTQAYVVDRVMATLTLLDPRTGVLGPAVQDVREAALQPAGERLYAIGPTGLRAFATDDLRAGRLLPLWHVEGSGFVDLAANDEVLAASKDGSQPVLLTYDGATGRQLANAALPGVTSGMAAGPIGGWVARAGYPPRLLRFDAALKQVAETRALYGGELYYDAPRGRYLMAGGALDDAAKRVIMAFAEDALTPTVVAEWPSLDVPDVFAPYGDDKLLGIASGGQSRLTYLDGKTLSPVGHTILGVGLTDMTLDEARDTLYVADDQDRLHALDLPSGRVRATWPGSAPIALDTANRRLYANRDRHLVALDTGTGEEIARFPQGGMPAPDPNRDLVYIADAGVTIYDRAGKQVGRLESTFPPSGKGGLVPNPYAFAARVNPANGYVVVTFNNGVPGSNNGSYLRVYPAETDSPIIVPGFFSFVNDVIFDPQGNVYASYSTDKNLEALQMLDATGQEVGRLGGRTGKLAFDPKTEMLYATGAGALARVSGLPLTLRDLYRGPTEVSQTVLHSDLGQLYVRDAKRSRIETLPLQELQPFDMRPAAAPGLPPEAEVAALNFARDGGETVLYATTSLGEHYRSRVSPGSNGADLRWEKLPVGSLPTWGLLTVAGDQVLFSAGQGPYGGDGVYRSRNGGDRWELLSAGLGDLRTNQPVAARGADEAYFVGRTSGIYAWRPGSSATGGSWLRILAAEKDYEWPGDLSVAPDGTLFLQSWGRLRRSRDGGQSWQDLSVPADSGSIAGFDPDYARTQTMFSQYCTTDRCQVMRSRDGGLNQQPILTLPPYGSLLKLSAHGKVLYLYGSGYPESRLYRSLDGGDTWQAADAAASQGSSAFAVAPDGQLWFGLKGALRVANPASIKWTGFAGVTPRPTIPQPQVTETPVPAATSSPSRPAGTPCARSLPDTERQMAQSLPELGCPVAQARPVYLARQSFQRGQMIWVSPESGLPGFEKVVLVLNDDGRWRLFADRWDEGQPESDPAIVTPEGLRQPIRGFGKVWREELGGAQAAIGWATQPEQGMTGVGQAWDGGLVLHFGNEQLVLLKSGTWQ